MKKLSTLLLLILSLLIFQYGIQAQDLEKKVKAIDNVMAEFMKLDQFSGCVLVANDGKPFYAKAFGEADKDFHVKNNLKMKFNIGSIGKTFTGTSIMQLAQRGKLSVADPVIKYLPDFPYGDKITIHHLLTHTSGMFNYFAHPDFSSKISTIRSVKDALPLIYDQKLLFDTPGERFSYSNSGIVTLGAVIEAVAGQSYPDYIQENILKPLGMNDTRINYLDEIVENRATGYDKSASGKLTRNIFRVPPANADGGIETTVENMLKFDQALYGEKLLADEYKKQMFTPFKENYGYCWRISQENGRAMIGHSGGAPGVSADFRRYIDDKYTIIVLSNYGGAAGAVSRTIEAIIFNEKFDMPRPTLGEFLLKKMDEKSFDDTIQNFDQLLKENGYTLNSSQILNVYGYQLLSEQKVDMAIEVFTLNVRQFPDEANPYDSLAEAYLAKGDKESAIANYKKALQIDPNLPSSKEALEKLTKNP
ncbi:serine hydrolase [candidate division KSB1 bacterium]|nr:serine hydrolase [candidate division KSB1 bacterium]